MTATPTTKWMKLARRLGWDGNPLRRRSDLVAAWLLPGAVAAFLALGPVVAAATVTWVRADVAAARHAESSYHRVTAVLLRSSPGPVFTDNGANTWLEWTLARWTLDGRRHVGDVPAAAKSWAGSTVSVWLDRAGHVMMPPVTTAQAGDRMLASTVVALAGLAAMLAGLAWLARRVLDRRRLAGWETAWLAVGPRWSRQG
jgi:hypothetical protein